MITRTKANYTNENLSILNSCNSYKIRVINEVVADEVKNENSKTT